MSDSRDTLDRVIEQFPGFARAKKRRWRPFEHVMPGRTAEELAEDERLLGVELPASYKTLLTITAGFLLDGGSVQIQRQHPFFHEFPTLEEMDDAQRQRVLEEGGHWPPPSEGMLCFAEMFMLADGDQALFDVSGGLQDGEYPVYYYAHEESPAAVYRIASGFEEFMNEFLTYPEWG
jgi:hypothetical protein